MRIEMTFDRQKVERQGWTMEAVQETVRKNFEARGLRCVTEGDALSVVGKGGEQDFSDLWAVTTAILRTDWFPALAAACVWHDDNGALGRCAVPGMEGTGEADGLIWPAMAAGSRSPSTCVRTH